VRWELDVHIWPRLAAKIALGVASLVADDDWVTTPNAKKLRHVLWNGDQSTVDAEMLPPGRSWSIAPFELDASNRSGLRPPEHLLAIEEFDGEQGVSFVFAGTLLYTVLLGRVSTLPLVSWLLDPIAGTCRIAPTILLTAELRARSD
jgi:hypothetical protein